MKGSGSVFETQVIEGFVLAAIAAHKQYPRSPERAFRRFDGQTPVAFHSLFCATLIAQEPALSAEVRRRGFETLLFHDLLKDTTAPFPLALSAEARQIVERMTFGDLDQEIATVFNRTLFSAEDRLFLLYAKAGNLLDDVPMTNPTYIDYVLLLAKWVEEEQEEIGKKLRVIPIVRCLCAFRPA